MSSDPTYRIEHESGQFVIRTQDGLAMLSTSDQQSAEHYLELLERAWKQGFLQGKKAAHSHAAR